MLPQTNRLLKGVVVDMICIRADGGQELGLGHIMRCISIASAIKSAGEEVCFILADENPVEFLRTRSLRYYVLESDYRQMEEEIDRLAPVLEKEKPNLILVDSYFVTEEYMIQLRRFAPLAYLDDMGVISFSADILINYNIFADYDMYREKAKQYLLGVAYAPLRTEFVQVDYPVRKNATGILLTTGGSDRYNLAGKFLDCILESEHLRHMDCYVVSGAYNPNLPYLEDRAKEHKNVHICRNVTNMCELMQKCDVAVTAGGSTMYELSAVGVPMVCFSFVDNQEQIVRGFEERNLVAFAGDYLSQKEDMIPLGIKALEQLTKDFEARERESRQLRETVDGMGAMRIASALIRMEKK